MSKFEMSPDLYFAALVSSAGEAPDPVTINRELCKDAMIGLVERYQLAGKSVLSLGCGHSFEEFWLFENSCDLTLNDIDLFADADSCAGAGLAFYHGDAAEALDAIPDNRFDMVYVSSFHPDEIRRESIQAEFIKTLTDDQAMHYITWPDDELPYSDTLYNSLAKVKAGGLAIFQHYRGGVCVDSNPHYIEAIEKQFQSAGVQLLEVYTFRRSTPHLLVVGYKGSASDALEFARSLSTRPEIRTFHGRYGDKSISTEVVKAFDLADDRIRPQIVFDPRPFHDPVPPAPPKRKGRLQRLVSRLRGLQ